jgi:gamma-glutamyl hercynylcysteine S-oxide synthase
VSLRAADDPVAIRHAGRELLSLALIDSRNHLLAAFAKDEGPAARRTVLHAAWFQEWWIARHVQRARGEGCDARAPRLAGIEPHADVWMVEADDAALPDAPTLRAYLAETLETTLDLLAGAAEDDTALHVYRNTLLHEDRLHERLAESLRIGSPPARVDHEAIWLPARRWLLGTERGAECSGLVPHNERWAHEVQVPEFEIDAQPVNWARYVEFASDGGYDRRELWGEAGWAWLQQTAGRRAPRFVEQMQGAVLIAGRDGKADLRRAAAGQPAMNLNRFEAEAWCRWAGRRLPTEPEWEQAACTSASRGFVWGQVFEWVAGSARGWPDVPAAAPGCLDAIPPPSSHGVQRGASFATRARRRHPKARRFVLPVADTMFCGFRSCAL